MTSLTSLSYHFTEEREKVRASTRPAPPPPSKTHQTAAQRPTAPSQAKPAPRDRGAIHSDVMDDDNEAREVENKVYMFDTESEDEDEPDVILTRDSPVRQRKAPVLQKEAPPVDEIEASIRNMSKHCPSARPDGCRQAMLTSKHQLEYELSTIGICLFFAN